MVMVQLNRVVPSFTPRPVIETIVLHDNAIVTTEQKNSFVFIYSLIVT